MLSDNISYFIAGLALILFVMLVKTIKTWPSRPGFRLREHNLLELWIPPKVGLYVSKYQNGNVIGLGVRELLKGKMVLSASVLDWLLAHPKFIPDEWKGKRVFFWGTIYRYVNNGKLYVRYLYWHENKWESDDKWLGEGCLPGYMPEGYLFGHNDPAAVFPHWWRK